MINAQTGVLTRIDGEITNLGLKVNAMEEGVKTTFIRIDKDLKALNDRIDCCRVQCDKVVDHLLAAEEKVTLLEEHSRWQRELIKQLLSHVEGMEGHLCCCGKDRQVLGEITHVLDIPIILGQDVPKDNVSDGSYHTPPIASLSTVPSTLLVESDKENGLVLYNSKLSLETRLVEIEEDPMENVDPVPVLVPVFDFARIARLMTVCGQRTVHSLGPPKSLYHPYSMCCAIGKQSTTH